MTRRLLHLETSPRGSRSRSSRVATALIEALGPVEAERLNLFGADLPHFDGPVIEGRYALIEGRAIEPAVEAAWREIRGYVDHLLGFDLWVISTPMWNFGIPYPLKHYIDIVTQPDMLFRVNEQGVDGLAAGRTAILIGSGALDLSGEAGRALDHQMAFLRTWLGFVGVTDIRSIDLRPTYAPEAEVEAATREAEAAARQLAAELV